MRVLIVEDERPLADAVARGLRHRAIAVDIAYEGESALRKADVVDYDVVVLDRDLPRVHGDEVCRALCTGAAGPAILMLTASGELDQIVEGLSLGADDYLAKPFAFEELLARVHALGRRPRRILPPVLGTRGCRARSGSPRGPAGRQTGRAAAQGVRGAALAARGRRRRGIE